MSNTGRLCCLPLEPGGDISRQSCLTYWLTWLGFKWLPEDLPFTNESLAEFPWFRLSVSVMLIMFSRRKRLTKTQIQAALAPVAHELPENKLCGPCQQMALLPLGIPGGAETPGWPTSSVQPAVQKILKGCVRSQSKRILKKKKKKVLKARTIYIRQELCVLRGIEEWVRLLVVCVCPRREGRG